MTTANEPTKGPFIFLKCGDGNALKELAEVRSERDALKALVLADHAKCDIDTLRAENEMMKKIIKRCPYCTLGIAKAIGGAK